MVKQGTQALQQQSTALTQRESFIAKGDVTGTEGITKDDLRLPRLAIAQGLSTQLVTDDSSYIPDLKMFDMFNDLIGTIYGRGPLTFIAVRRDVRRIEFIPRDEGGGIKDTNVPIGDPRCEWTEGADGERLPPVATKFVEFVALLLDENGNTSPEQAIVISIKDTNKFNRRAAERLTGFIKMKQKPIYAGLYTIASKSEKNDSGTFGVPVINQAGLLDNPTVDDATWKRNKALYQIAAAFAASLEGKTITVEREPGDEPFDPDAFDTAAMDSSKSDM
jgi:hypothetical protein